MDADFLTFYGIDLRDPDTHITAEAFFARAFRLFNYRGAMRDALQAEQQKAEERGEPQRAAAQPTQVGSSTDAQGTRWVSPDQMKTMFPDLF